MLLAFALLVFSLRAQNTSYHVLYTQISDQGAIQLDLGVGQPALCLPDAFILNQTFDQRLHGLASCAPARAPKRYKRSVFGSREERERVEVLWFADAIEHAVLV